MSKLSEYSKFDNLEDSDDERDTEIRDISSVGRATVQGGTGIVSSNNANPVLRDQRMATKQGSERGRYVFECGGRKIYEWEQNLEGKFIFLESVGTSKIARLLSHLQKFEVFFSQK